MRRLRLQAAAAALALLPCLLGAAAQPAMRISLRAEEELLRRLDIPKFAVDPGLLKYTPYGLKGSGRSACGGFA